MGNRPAQAFSFPPFQAHSLRPQVLCPGPASHLHRGEAHPGCFELAVLQTEGERLFPEFWDTPEQCYEGNKSPWLFLAISQMGPVELPEHIGRWDIPMPMANTGEGATHHSVLIGDTFTPAARGRRQAKDLQCRIAYAQWSGRKDWRYEAGWGQHLPLCFPTGWSGQRGHADCLHHYRVAGDSRAHDRMCLHTNSSQLCCASLWQHRTDQNLLQIGKMTWLLSPVI